MAEIVIRPATHDPEDMDTLRSLLRAYASHLAANPTGAANICIDNFEQELHSLPAPYTALVLAFVDGRPAGCAALKPLSCTAESACEMKRLWVGSAFRGLGLGRKLIARTLELAAASGYDTLYLDTVPAAMPEANHLYASLGFSQVERYNSNTVADIVFFRKDLHPVNSSAAISGNHARY